MIPVHPRIPSLPNGDSYAFSQSESTVTVSLPVSAAVSKADVSFEFPHDNGVLLKVAGDIRFAGRLIAPVKKSECVWHFDDYEWKPFKTSIATKSHPYKTLHLVLKKTQSGVEWPVPVLAGVFTEKLTGKTTFQCDPHSIFLCASLINNSDRTALLAAMTEAGDAGSISAILKLAAWYELGEEEMPQIPVKRNLKASIEWHRKAALLGNCEACYIVMSAHAAGTHSIKKDYAVAVQWARAAIVCGHGHDIMRSEQPSLYNTIAFQAALIYMEGGSGLGDPDPSSAAELWRYASEINHPQSSWNLGIFLLNGFGVDVDIPAAVDLISRGIAGATNLGLPPQLSGLNKDELNAVVLRAQQLKAEGAPVQIDSIVKYINSAAKAAENQSNIRVKKVSKKASRHDGASDMNLGWSTRVMQGLALAAVIAGCIVIAKELRK